MTTTRMKFVGGERRYFVDGKEVGERVYRAASAREARETDKQFEKQRGRRFAMPGCFGDRKDWRLENGGKGRYCHQIGDRVNDPKGYCGSYREMLEKAKHKGYEVDTNN